MTDHLHVKYASNHLKSVNTLNITWKVSIFLDILAINAGFVKKCYRLKRLICSIWIGIIETCKIMIFLKWRKMLKILINPCRFSNGFSSSDKYSCLGSLKDLSSQYLQLNLGYDKPFTCKLCQQSFKKLQSFEYHVESSHFDLWKVL